MPKNTKRWAVKDKEDNTMGEPHLTRDEAKEAARSLNSEPRAAE